MIRLLVALAAAALFLFMTPTSHAAGRPQTPTMPAAFNWSGTYVGAVGGYGTGTSNQSDSGVPCSYFGTCPLGPSFDGSYKPAGGAVGGTIGVNWQQGAWVAGFEGDYSWAGISGSSGDCGASTPLPHACGASLESFGTARARLGYAVGATGGWLPYVTGGFAAGEVHGWDALLPASGSDFRSGWTFGGGVEAALTRNWTLKLEYLYIDLGSEQSFDVVPGVPETVSFNTNLFRVGVDYQFR